MTPLPTAVFFNIGYEDSKMAQQMKDHKSFSATTGDLLKKGEDNRDSAEAAPGPEDEGYVYAAAAKGETVAAPIGVESSRSQDEIYTLPLDRDTNEAREHPDIYDHDAVSPEGLKGLIHKNVPTPTDKNPDHTVEQLIARAANLMQLLHYHNGIGGKIHFSDGVIILKCRTKHDPQQVDAGFQRYFKKGFGIGKCWTHISFADLTREDTAEIGEFAARIHVGDLIDGGDQENFLDEAAFQDESVEQDADGNRAAMRLH